MGAASCKDPKSSKQEQAKDTSKKITIGVFGLDNAGKTSAVKAIEGAPTEDVEPTVGSQSTKVPYPAKAKNDNKSQERVTIIDVSGSRNFRQRSWPEIYKQIHGLIFVLDASEKKRLAENKDTLDDLLEHADLKDKPILILANKQDRGGAIKKEESIKEKLDIEELKRKHKIELCQAVPTAGNKSDEAIRHGFSWLIRTIEENYETLSSGVKESRSPAPPKPVERKSYSNNKRKPDKSDQSDNDDDIVYAGRRRATPPPVHRKPLDTRSTTNSFKPPELDLKRTKPQTSGHETYDESDEDQTRTSSRPNISRPQANLTSATGFNKKKKLTGVTNKEGDSLSKKSHDNEPKSFRSTYEPFPEDTPWSSARKPTKAEELPFRLNTKSSLTNDSNKRAISPLVHDTKYYTNHSLSKRDDDENDDENRNGFNRTPNIRSTMNKSLPSTQKATSGIYGGGSDDDEDEEKNKSSFNRSLQRPPDRSGLSNGYRGAMARPPSSPSLASSRPKIDEENDLPSSLLSRSAHRPNVNREEILSTFSKASTATKRFDGHDDDDDDDRFKSSARAPLRSRPSAGNDFDRPPSVSKINTNSKYMEEEDDNKWTSKPFAHSKYGETNRSVSPLRLTTRSKRDDDDDEDGPSSKAGARSNYGSNLRSSSSSFPSPLTENSRRKNDDDDEDRFGSSSKLAARPTANTTHRLSPSSSAAKLYSRSNFEEDEEVSAKPAARYGSSNNRHASPSRSPPLKSGSRSKYGDDDADEDLRSKPTTRSTYKSTSRSSPSPPPAKQNNRSKFEDDDDDHDPRSKPAGRSDFKGSSRFSRSPSPPAKTSSRWNKDDDDDDDDQFRSTSKTTARTNMKSNSRSSPSRSKYDDDDDDDDDRRSKPATRSNFKTNDRSSPSPPPYSKSSTRWKSPDDHVRPSSAKKPTSQSKFEDDDDYFPSSKRNDHASRHDDFSSSRGGYNSSRIRSNS